jgi:hypothetical protein
MGDIDDESRTHFDEMLCFQSSQEWIMNYEFGVF